MRKKTEFPSTLILLAMSFFIYSEPSMLPALFFTAARFLISAGTPLSNIHAEITRRILEHLFACVFFGIQLKIVTRLSQNSPSLSKNPAAHASHTVPPTTVTAPDLCTAAKTGKKGMTAKTIQQFFISLCILTACGLLAAGINRIIASRAPLSSLHNSASFLQVNFITGKRMPNIPYPGGRTVPLTPRAVAELSGSWFGVLLLIINTLLAAYKEELIYRAVPGIIMLHVIESIEHKKKLAQLLAILFLSLPFALAHEGLGTMTASFVLGISFLYLVHRGWSWKTLAAAHAGYNICILFIFRK